MVLITNSFKGLLAAFLLLIAFFSQAQNLHLEYLSNIKTPIKSERSFMNSIVIAKHNNIIYFTDKNPTNLEKRITIYSYDYEKNKYDSLLISKEKHTKDLFGDRRLSICVTDKDLIILTDNDIFVFKIKNKILKFSKKIKNPKFFNDIYYLENNEFLLYVNYDFHPMDAKNKHVWGKLNIEEGKIIVEKKMPDDNVMFSYFVNKWISTYKGLIAYSMTSSYNIKFFDSKFNPIDSLVSNKLDSNGTYIFNLEKINRNSKEGIYEIKKLEDSVLTRIQKIFLLDSTHILVLLKLPKYKNYVLDSWEKSGAIWLQKNTATVPAFYKEGEAYSKKTPPVFSLFGNVNGLIYLEKRKFISVYYPFRDYIETESFNRKIDFDNPTNEIVKKGDIFYGIQEFIFDN